MNPSGLLIVATLAIPPAVATHRFVIEAREVTASLVANGDPKRQVVGTANSPSKVQLYGWNMETACHSDNTGYIYGLCLNEGTTFLFARDDKNQSSLPTLEIELVQGTLFRLNDRFNHWTQDTGPRIAAFLGPFREPDDELALSKISEALGLLADHAYYEAPRVSEGFLVQGEDECLATDDFLNYDRMLKSDAMDRDAFILECGECGAPAVTVDQHWPIYEDRSACAKCLVLDVDLD